MTHDMPARTNYIMTICFIMGKTTFYKPGRKNNKMYP